MEGTWAAEATIACPCMSTAPCLLLSGLKKTIIASNGCVFGRFWTAGRTTTRWSLGGSAAIWRRGLLDWKGYCCCLISLILSRLALWGVHRRPTFPLVLPAAMDIDSEMNVGMCGPLYFHIFDIFGRGEKCLCEDINQNGGDRLVCMARGSRCSHHSFLPLTKGKMKKKICL